MITPIFLAILLFTLLIFLKLKDSIDFLQPSVIFSIIILSTYLLTTFRLSDLQNFYPLWFTLLIIFLVIIFFIGERISNYFSVSNTMSGVKYSSNMMRAVTFVMCVTIIFSFFMMVSILGAPPALSKSNRAEYFVSGWGSIVITQSSFWGLILYDRFNKNSNGLLFWIYFLTISVIAFLLSNKYQIMYMIVLYLIAHNSFRKKINIKNMLIIFISSILVFVVLFEFVYKDMYGVSLDTLYYSYKMKLPSSLSFLTQPYLYVSFNFDNLFNYLSNNTQSFYGLKTFGSLIDIFGLNSLFESKIFEMNSEWKNILRIKSMTTGTMFQDFAQDGKLLGMIILTFICGFWSGITYKLFKFNKDFSTFFLYSATIVAIFMSFFSNVFTSKVTIINLVTAIMLNKILKINLFFGRRRNE
ncbi:TPA: O-antigen polymerase [Streptococcus suis]